MLAVESVRSRDLEDCLAEAWFDACLRRGSPEVAFEDVELELRPAWSDRDGRRYCVGFTLDRAGPAPSASPARGGSRAPVVRPTFPRTVLEPVALRAASRLVAAGVLAADDRIHYELRAEAASEPSPERRSSSAVRVAAGGRRTPLELLRAPVTPLLARAELRLVSGGVPIESGDHGHFPVFYTRGAHERAERVARKGGAQSPPVETGGLLVGPLCLCPDTGEVFAVVVDVIEAAHAEETKYSLTFSGETWDRIQAVMRARRGNPDTRSHRILGQTHGHSFLPLDGAPPCEHCFEQEWCPRNTAFMSAEDLQFCRAVFRGEPWQLSHVFGLNARGEEVEAFFGQRGGELVPRGYRILDSFDETDMQRRVK